MTSFDKRDPVPVMVYTDDPAVISSIKNNGIMDVLGFCNHFGAYWAEESTLKQWRARRAGEVVGSHEAD